MRARMLRDLPPDGPWDVKLRAGGQIEVEFIAQVLQLIHAREAPDCVRPPRASLWRGLPRRDRCRRTMRALLIRADHVWRTVQGMLRITVGRGAREELPDASARALIGAVAEALDQTGPVDLACAARHAG